MISTLLRRLRKLNLRLAGAIAGARLEKPAATIIYAPSPERVPADEAQARIVTKWLDMPYVEVQAHERTLRYAATGSSSLKRVRTIFTKEPTTLAWIDFFEEGETVFDIGANVGMYTIYAAVTKGAKVYAFEPEALNFAELNKNLFLNDLHETCIGYCVALSDIDKTDKLLLSDFGVGISYHDFEEDSWKGDMAFSADWVVKKEGRRQQGAIGRRIDSLIADGLPIPDHVKIDVDGLEHRVVSGMVDLLKHPKLKTVLIEVNFEDDRNLAIIDLMQRLGWRYSFAQISCNRAIIFSAKQIERYKREKRGGLNYIFFKDEKWDRYFADFAEKFVPGDLSTYSAS